MASLGYYTLRLYGTLGSPTLLAWSPPLHILGFYVLCIFLLESKKKEKKSKFEIAFYFQNEKNVKSILTGKSVSEALILVSVNPQYDDRL